MKTETIYFNHLQREITYYIGKNDKDNFEIIDASNPNDIWFHANNISSSHVILKLSNIDTNIDKKDLRQLIKKGALLCKQNTNKLNNNNIFEFIYTEIKNIEKTDKIGCVITKNTKTISC